MSRHRRTAGRCRTAATELQPLRLTLRAGGSGIYVTASGRLDASTSHLLGRLLSALLARERATAVALDLSDVRFSDHVGV